MAKAGVKMPDEFLAKLRQMMADGLAYRRDYQQQPPRVEYGLTELGKEMLPIVDALADFGNYYKSVVGQNENE